MGSLHCVCTPSALQKLGITLHPPFHYPCRILREQVVGAPGGVQIEEAVSLAVLCRTPVSYLHRSSAWAGAHFCICMDFAWSCFLVLPYVWTERYRVVKMRYCVFSPLSNGFQGHFDLVRISRPPFSRPRKADRNNKWTILKTLCLSYTSGQTLP